MQHDVVEAHRSPRPDGPVLEPAPIRRQPGWLSGGRWSVQVGEGVPYEVAEWDPNSDGSIGTSGPATAPASRGPGGLVRVAGRLLGKTFGLLAATSPGLAVAV